MDAAKLRALCSMVDDPLLRLSDVLPLLGVRHRSTVMRWGRAGKIALVKVGSHYRVRASEVLRISGGTNWLDNVPSAEATR